MLSLIVLGHFVETLGTHNLIHLQQEFFKLDAFLESHMHKEEEQLFPRVRLLVEKEKLEELAHKAEDKILKFSVS